MKQQRERKHSVRGVLRAILCAVATAALLSGALPEAEAIGHKPLEGRTISVMGDSISTYMGWSDKQPITGPECAYRYGEPYYGPVDSDCHHTGLLVSDTWWHQAATELGAEILVSNAGNSTGLLYASYPQDAGWQQYLQDMLAYRPALTTWARPRRIPISLRCISAPTTWPRSRLPTTARWRKWTSTR